MQAVLDSIAGYDLNPVALQAARANFVGRARRPLPRRPPAPAAPRRRDPRRAGRGVRRDRRQPALDRLAQAVRQRREAGDGDLEALRPLAAAAGERPAAGEPADGRPRDARLRVRRRPPRGTRRSRRHARAQRAPDRRPGWARVPALRGRRAPVRAAARRPLRRGRPFAPDASNQPVFLVSRGGRERALSRRRPPAGAARATRPAAAAGRSTAPSRRRSGRSRADGADLLAGGSNGWRFGVGLHTRGANGVYFVEVLARAVGRPRRDRQPAAGRARPARSGVGAAAWRPRSSTRSCAAATSRAGAPSPPATSSRPTARRRWARR